MPPVLVNADPRPSCNPVDVVVDAVVLAPNKLSPVDKPPDVVEVVSCDVVLLPGAPNELEPNVPVPLIVD